MIAGGGQLHVTCVGGGTCGGPGAGSIGLWGRGRGPFPKMPQLQPTASHVPSEASPGLLNSRCDPCSQKLPIRSNQEEDFFTHTLAFFSPRAIATWLFRWLQKGFLSHPFFPGSISEAAAAIITTSFCLLQTSCKDEAEERAPEKVAVGTASEPGISEVATPSPRGFTRTAAWRRQQCWQNAPFTREE